MSNTLPLPAPAEPPAPGPQPPKQPLITRELIITVVAVLVGGAIVLSGDRAGYGLITWAVGWWMKRPGEAGGPGAPTPPEPPALPPLAMLLLLVMVLSGGGG